MRGCLSLSRFKDKSQAEDTAFLRWSAGDPIPRYSECETKNSSGFGTTSEYSPVTKAAKGEAATRLLN